MSASRKSNRSGRGGLSSSVSRWDLSKAIHDSESASPNSSVGALARKTGSAATSTPTSTPTFTQTITPTVEQLERVVLGDGWGLEGPVGNLNIPTSDSVMALVFPERCEARVRGDNHVDVASWPSNLAFDEWSPPLSPQLQPVVAQLGASSESQDAQGFRSASRRPILGRLGGRDLSTAGEPLYDSDAKRSGFGPLVRRALLVAVLGWTTKVGTMLYVNNSLGGKVKIRTWRMGIRYFAFQTPRANFTRITSSSTVMLSLVMLAVLIVAMFKNSHPVNVGGWMFAPIATGNALIADLVMQRYSAPYLDWERLRWAFGSAALSCVLIFVWIAIEHPHERFIAFTDRMRLHGTDGPQRKWR
jgi:hypothetical protein